MTTIQTTLFKEVEALQTKALIAGEKPLAGVLNSLMGAMLMEDTLTLLAFTCQYSVEAIKKMEDSRATRN